MTHPNPDLDFVPLGEAHLKQIEDLVVAHGDAAESVALEAKSDLDLTKPAGRGKVAKFILGMANRDPVVASQHFKGYAVMVIGAAKGAAPGISNAPEQHPLNDALAKYLGNDGPSWNLARRRVDDTHDVVYVIVDPPQPGNPVYICWGNLQGPKNQDNLQDGAVYIRDSTQTRPTRAKELQDLIARGARAPAPTVTMTVTGSALHMAGGDGLLERMIQADADTIRARRKQAGSIHAWQSTVTGWNARAGVGTSDAELGDILLERAQTFRERWPGCLDLVAAVAGPRLAITVTNTSERYLNDPEIHITIARTRHLAPTDPEDVDRHELLPEPPYLPRIGLTRSQIRELHPLSVGRATTRVEDTAEGCMITFRPHGLPPHTPRALDHDLVLNSLDHDTTALTGTWTIVSPDLTGQLHGAFDIPVQTTPLRELYRSALDKVKSD